MHFSLIKGVGGHCMLLEYLQGKDCLCSGAVWVYESFLILSELMFSERTEL